MNSNLSFNPETLKFGHHRWFLSSVNPKFHEWPREIIGHLFYITLSIVHDFKAIDEFKVELQSGNAQFGSKSEMFCPAWPWNLMEDLEKQKHISSILRQALYIISKPLMNSNLSYGLEIWSKSVIFLSHVTFKFDGWPWKTIGQLVYAASSFVLNFVAIGEFKFELQSGNPLCGSKWVIFVAMWPWNSMDDIEKY